MSQSRWLLVLTLVAGFTLTGAMLTGCSGSKKVATRDSEESAPESSGRPNRKAAENDQDSTGQVIGEAAKKALPESNSQKNSTPVEFDPSKNNLNNKNVLPDSKASGRNQPNSQPKNKPQNNAKKIKGVNVLPNSAGAKPTNGGKPINNASSAGKKVRLIKAAPTGRRGTNPGDTMPEIEGKDMDGQRFKLSDYKGKVIMVDFWGDW